MMNLWECSDPGCPARATGCGGAIGLRAIGWWFEPGKLLCPLHRPDTESPRHNPLPCDNPLLCEKCLHIAAANLEANHWQFLMQRMGA